MTSTGSGATIVPLYSLMVATEPLPDERGTTIGLHDMETFADDRQMVIYGQRTADGRLAFGGRGAPYRFGSGIDAATEASSRDPRSDRRHAPRTRPGRSATLGSPIAGAACSACRVTGARRSGSTVRPGLAWAGGYVGEGVAATESGRSHARRPRHAAPTPTSCRCRGSVTGRGAGSPSRCVGSASMRACGSPDWIDRYEAKHRQRTPRAASVLQRIMR